MIKIIHNSLFNELPPYNVILHQVNCLGIANAGIALQVKQHFPMWFQDYHSYCMHFKDNTKELLGSTHTFNVNSKQIICSAFAQDGISKAFQMTDYAAWDKILKKIELQTKTIKEVTGKTWTIHIPYNIGCGLGGGDWNKMMELFNLYFDNSTVQLFIHKI